MNRSGSQRVDSAGPNLSVKGSGYLPVNAGPFLSSSSTQLNIDKMFKPPSSLAPKKSAVAFGTTVRKVRIASQPPVASSSLKRSGSVGSVLTGNRIALAPRSATSSSSGERVQSHNYSHQQQSHHSRHSQPHQSSFEQASSASQSKQIICNCQHPADLSFLEDVYVQNLRTQVEVLGFENAYLKNQSHSTPQLNPIIDTFSGQIPMPMPSSSYSKPPLVREETVTVPSQPWGSAPSSSAYNTRNVSSSKHVGFRNSRSQEEEDELFTRLEESLHKEQRLEDKLRKQVAENRRLSAINEQVQQKLEEVTQELQQLEGKVTKERRSLLEDNVEFQRRLDELTPLLAEKEAQIAKLLNEKGGLSSRLRTATTQLSALQNRVEEQKREESIMSEVDSERKQEIERLQNRVRQLENESDNSRERESNFIEEIASLQRRLKEEELSCKKEAALHHKMLEENDFLVKENSSISSQVNRLESIIAQQKSEINDRRFSSRKENEIYELRQAEKGLKNEIARLEDKLRREQDASRTLETQIKDREYGQSESRQLLTRTQKELEGLEALSKSLTNDNTGLREEKISLNERIQFLQKKLGDKDSEIRTLTVDLDEFKRKYNEVQLQLKKDVDLQSERSHELEAIVRKVHELSDALPRDVREKALRTKSRSNSSSSRRQYIAEQRFTSSSVASADSPSASSGARMMDRIPERYRRM